MTTIAWDGKTLAADKRMSFGTEFATVTKITRSGDCLIGWAGGSALGRAMMAWFVDGCEPANFPAMQREEGKTGVLLVIHSNKRIEHYAQEPYPIPVEDSYYAVGSGSGFASAAMYLGHDAKRAVEVSCALDMNSGSGIDTLEF